MKSPTKHAVTYLHANHSLITWAMLEEISLKKTASGRACVDLLTSDRDMAKAATYLLNNVDDGVYNNNLVIALSGEVYQYLSLLISHRHNDISYLNDHNTAVNDITFVCGRLVRILESKLTGVVKAPISGAKYYEHKVLLVHAFNK